MNKFSTFAFHVCIMAYIFKFAKFSKQHLKTIKREAKPFPNLPTKCIAQIGKQIKLYFQIVQEVPRMHLINICQRQIFDKQRNKMRIQNWFKSFSIFETMLNYSKIPTKNMGSFPIILGSSINIFIIL